MIFFTPLPPKTTGFSTENDTNFGGGEVADRTGDSWIGSPQKKTKHGWAMEKLAPFLRRYIRLKWLEFFPRNPWNPTFEGFLLG